jgi:hypothetical protein
MPTFLNWKKGFLKRTYVITSEGRTVGTLEENRLNKSAKAELFGNKYSYKTDGIFNQVTEIFRLSDHKVLGRITYSTLRTSAQFEYQDKSYYWKTENWNHSRWRLYTKDESLIEYRGSASRGELTASNADDVLMLTGLFIANYFWQNVVAIMVVLFIIIILN